jgi:Sec-independent protein translocase protein TatA
VGSPHVDVNDTCPQYAMSLGDFADGGELCVETQPCEVVLVDTHARLARIDGRFPHWVREFKGAVRDAEEERKKAIAALQAALEAGKAKQDQLVANAKAAALAAAKKVAELHEKADVDVATLVSGRI